MKVLFARKSLIVPRRLYNQLASPHKLDRTSSINNLYLPLSRHIQNMAVPISATKRSFLAAINLNLVSPEQCRVYDTMMVSCCVSQAIPRN